MIAASESTARAAPILDPVCRALAQARPPLQIVYVTRPPQLVGIVAYPGCIGSVKMKAITRRYALACIQRLDRTNERRPTVETVPGSCVSKRTLTSFGSFTLVPLKICRGSAKRLYRLRYSLLISRGPLVDTRTGYTDWQFAPC
jgi:hypothetical protein